VPVGEWIKGPLRPWAEDLLDPGLIRGQGWFDADTITARWRQHLSGQRDSTPALWAILMFQSWLAAVHSDTSATADRAAATSVSR
jgi:asparagine synthase (glutamine-hydrolysing)